MALHNLDLTFLSYSHVSFVLAFLPVLFSFTNTLSSLFPLLIRLFIYSALLRCSFFISKISGTFYFLLYTANFTPSYIYFFFPDSTWVVFIDAVQLD